MKNKDLIIAYANGKTIMARPKGEYGFPGVWMNLTHYTGEALRVFLGTLPMNGDEEWEFRIKPEAQS